MQAWSAGIFGGMDRSFLRRISYVPSPGRGVAPCAFWPNLESWLRLARVAGPTLSNLPFTSWRHYLKGYFPFESLSRGLAGCRKISDLMPGCWRGETRRTSNCSCCQGRFHRCMRVETPKGVAQDQKTRVLVMELSVYGPWSVLPNEIASELFASATFYQLKARRHAFPDRR